MGEAEASQDVAKPGLGLSTRVNTKDRFPRQEFCGEEEIEYGLGRRRGRCSMSSETGGRHEGTKANRSMRES